MKIKYLCYIVLLCFFPCCTKVLDSSQGQTPETINGFIVRWRKQMSSEQKNVVREILNNMVRIEGGTYLMGATLEQTEYARPNELPVSYNRVSDFYICKYEISDEQYCTILNSESDMIRRILYLSRNDWTYFIEVLNELTLLKFDFPTEAQWEYAARGGRLSKSYIFPGSNDIRQALNGSVCHNELGIYNMGDGKSEWCKDYYELYKNDRLYENRYISAGKYFVVRGGNQECKAEVKKYQSDISTMDMFGHFCAKRFPCIYDYRYCRVSARSYYPSYIKDKDIGCRLVINNNE